MKTPQVPAMQGMTPLGVAENKVEPQGEGNLRHINRQISYPFKTSIREVIKIAWDCDLWLARGEKAHALATIEAIRQELKHIEEGLR